MSSDIGFLALQLIGPLQSWGFDSQFNRRSTSLMPTKSAIAGMCCAAKGYSRGSEAEKDFLDSFSKTKMIAISVPRSIQYKNNTGEQVYKKMEIRRLQDYHTVEHTLRANGNKNKECVITYRQYLNDASFGIVLSGERAFLEKIEAGLLNPKWGIWLGRKSCIPSAPILPLRKDKGSMVKPSQEDALRLLLGDKPFEDFIYQADVDSFHKGEDSIPDNPLSFATEDRQFSPRRITTHEPNNRVT